MTNKVNPIVTQAKKAITATYRKKAKAEGADSVWTRANMPQVTIDFDGLLTLKFKTHEIAAKTRRSVLEGIREELGQETKIATRVDTSKIPVEEARATIG